MSQVFFLTMAIIDLAPEGIRSTRRILMDNG